MVGKMGFSFGRNGGRQRIFQLIDLNEIGVMICCDEVVARLNRNKDPD